MKLVDILMKFFTWLITVAFGVFLVLLCVKNEQTMEVLQTNSDFFLLRYGMGVAGGGLILIELLWILSKLRRNYATRELSFSTDQGDVEVSISSLESSMRRIIEKIDDVYSVALKLYVPKKRRRPVYCHIKTSVKSGVVLPERIAEIHRVAQEKFKELLKGIDRDIQTKVHVKLIDAKGEEPEDVSEKQSSGHSVFSGPEYPVSNTDED